MGYESCAMCHWKSDMGRSARLLLVSLLWSHGAPAPSAASEAPPLVFAAASLAGALQELLVGGERPLQGAARLSVASSSTLARQIAQGAPADLYLAANTEWMDYLQARNMLVPGTRVDLLANELVLICPSSALMGAPMRPGSDLSGAFRGRLALGDPDHVPAGIYARQALEHMGWWEQMQDRLAPAPDVRGALAYVAQGHCAAGVVYATDALASDVVTVVGRFPPESHAPIVYPLAVIRGHDEAALGVAELLRSARAAAIFEQYGFTVLSRSQTYRAGEEHKEAPAGADRPTAPVSR
jgi:molybdate transport system substrate-binding protein